MLHDVENPEDEEDPPPATLFSWVKSLVVSLWQAYKVRNYYPLKM